MMARTKKTLIQMGNRLAQLESWRRQTQQMGVGGQVLLDEKARDQPYWDSDTILPGANRLRYFVSRVHQNGVLAGAAKTLSEWNLQTEASFPAPITYTYNGLKFHTMSDPVTGAPPLATDLELLKAYSIIRFRAGNRIQWEFPLEQFSAPGMIGGSNAVAAGGHVNFGPPGIGDWFQFDVGFTTEPGLTFEFEIETSAEYLPDRNIRAKVEMLGQLSNVVR